MKKILVRDPEKKRNFPVEREKLTSSAGDILNDGDIDIGIELMGGEKPAKDIILEALDWKKNVITAYILTKMTDDNMEFEKALELVQKLGFAESDPFKDIEAIDGAHKTAIVSSIAFGVAVKPEQVFRKGILEIT